jgi:septum formation protein
MICLASTSKYRVELLKRLGVPFTAKAPLCDEDHFKKFISDPETLALTLAKEKARSLRTDAEIVIGGDQLAAWQNEILGKPKTVEKAFQQLKKLQGSTHRLLTAVCIIKGDQEFAWVHKTEIEMQPLTDEEIDRYIERDQPLDCAGSYKFEKSGIGLIKSIRCDDFSAIEGLPLIAIGNLLRQLHVPLFSEKK